MNQFFLYENTKNEFITAAGTNFFRDKEITFTTYQNVYALPSKNVWQDGKKVRWGGLVEESGTYITESGRFRTEDRSLSDGTMVGGYEFKKSFCSTIKGESIYCGEFLEHWGHFLLESTTRLWYVVQNKKPGQKLIFVARKKFKLVGNFKIFFELLGIDLKDIILITRPTKLETVIVPAASSVLGCYYTKEFLVPFTYIQQNIVNTNVNKITSEPSKRIYLSRRKCKIRFIIGEDKLEHIFKQNGFSIVYPEHLSLKELIALFQNAEYIAGISGTTMHNALFCSTNTKLIVLNRTSLFNYPQGLINQANNLDAIYTDAYFNFLPAQDFYWLGVTPCFKTMCQTLNFLINKTTAPSKKEAQLFFARWLKELPRAQSSITHTNFLNSAEVAYLLFSQMATESWLHQKLDLLKYTILSKISWGAYKKKYQTKLQHYQEKYGTTLMGKLPSDSEELENSQIQK